MQWKELRPLQVDAIHQLVEDSSDLVIAAATAAGKTEAAFLPILSLIAGESTGSVRALYVGPLKALINDQFARVEQLCERLQMPVYRWHGDVSQSHKKKLVDAPGGVLLITPESLESLFVNRSEQIGQLFDGLRFVVIDEVHSFLGNERGLHLKSLLGRLRQLNGAEAEPGYRIVGLSATIGDLQIAQRYLNPASPDDVRVISHEAGKELRFKVYAYLQPAPDPTHSDEDEEEELLTVRRDMASDMAYHTDVRSTLMFANSKGDVEEFCDFCRNAATADGSSARYVVHHGSLSAEIREDAEYLMKESSGPITAFCSSTLEMGIDIGSVAMVGQIGPPFSVSSLKQRLGRSGRGEGEPQVLRAYIECGEASPDATIFDRLHLDLVQTVAVVELLVEGWIEPDLAPECDLSTLTQQIISVIAQHGGASAESLYQRLCDHPSSAFQDIEENLFAQLLRVLGEHDIIEQVATGDLILGLLGERIRNHYGFYAVFQTPDVFTVVHDGTSIGELELIPHKDEYLLFAGRRWQVDDIDIEKSVLYVRPAKGWKRPKFTSQACRIHDRVRQRMRSLLDSNTNVQYLNETGVQLLAMARETAQAANACNRPLLQIGPRKTAIMTWKGTRLQETLAAMIASEGHKCVDEGVALVVNLPASDTEELVRHLAGTTSSGSALARYVFPPMSRKYDRYLSKELLYKCIERGRLEVERATSLLIELAARV